MTTNLIIFDFDGTLADTTATILQTYKMTIAAIGAPDRTDSECRATIGLPLREGFRQLFPSFTDEELNRCTDTYRDIFNTNMRAIIPSLYPGVEKTLNELAAKGIRMSIASSRNHESLVELCEMTGITGYFSLILGADDVERAKPNPEPVMTTLAKLNAEPAGTLVVGDMPVDIAMGNGAGCRTVGVTYGNSDRNALAAAGADLIIDSFTELLNASLCDAGVSKFIRQHGGPYREALCSLTAKNALAFGSATRSLIPKHLHHRPKLKHSLQSSCKALRDKALHIAPRRDFEC